MEILATFVSFAVLVMGLDEKAIQAVQQYKFKPGMKNGKPVRVELTISLNFNETAN